MNIVSNHNRLLRGAPVYTAGGDMWTSGLEYEDGKITGYSGSAFGPDCPCDSAAIVDSAFDKSTAWVEEQNYLTAHQDVSNLPYVQNSSLEFNGALISGISGSGFYAVSADNANYADQAGLANSASESEHAISATVSQEAVHAGSADYANSANSALNAEKSIIARTALTANFLDGGWEHDEDGFITAYNSSAFAGAGAGGGKYEGIDPIVVNNEEMRISAKSAVLGVQDPLYFVEDSQTATVIGIHDSAFPTFEGTEDGKVSAINGSAINTDPVVPYSAGTNIDITNNVISVTGIVDNAYHANSADYVQMAQSAHSAELAITALNAASSNSATYDSLGRKIVDTYLTAHQDWTNTIQNASGNAYNSAVNWVVDQHYLTAVTGDNTPYSAGANIDITNHVVSGKDWTDEITAAANSAFTAATAQIPSTANLPYVENTALESNGILISAISGSGFLAESANHAFNTDHANDADYVLSGWEYDENNRISAYNGSAFAGQGSQGIEYEGVLPIVVNNVEHKISAQSARLGVQDPLYFVEDSNTATVIGISGLPEVEGLMYESGLGLTGGQITSYNGSAFSADRAGYAVSATSANGAISSLSANYVLSGWEKSDNKITAYNGTAFSAQGGSNPQVPVIGAGSVTISKPSTTVIISGKDYSNDITAASSYAYNQATAQIPTGQYIPYTNITTGDSGTTCYNVASSIRVTAQSGWVEMYNQNKENENEAHLQVGQNYTGNKSFWAELDGAGGGFLQMNWNSGTVGPNAHSSYADGTTASIALAIGSLIYRSATHSLTATGEGGDGENKVWQLGSERLRFWNQWGTASFGPRGTDVYDSIGNNRWYTTAVDSATRFRIEGSAGDGTLGAVDITPGYINFYNSNWGLDATINKGQISAWNQMIGSIPSRVVASTADATGSNILYIVTGS